ncbi:NAD(P)/FAD-dependent oxidoreductase [Halomicrobium urmianum]|uniref:NAD(P)/FAD-dependent oxidoreductase n=1 Tax=Halomicrobium urmianum TaxID=1586233 RepID=UPI001CD9CE8A|nr:FAD-dependent oxidoreductase [Halomicrobium urmianum]
MTATVAVVGAGAAGAAAAYALRDEPVDVTVFEKSGGLCGRAATRRRGDCTYEYGANYLTSDDERVTELVTEALPTDGLVDVTEPVWTFDAAGEISEGDRGDGHKWTYEDGITQLAKRLFAATDATVHRNTRVATLASADGGWTVEDAVEQSSTSPRSSSSREDADVTDHGHFDAALLTPPAPQSADLLGQARWDHVDCRRLRESIASVPYRAVVSAVLHYDFELDLPYYALVNADRDHDVGWVGREECKPGHVPDGEALLLVQMAPDWSAERFHDPEDEVVADAAEATAALLSDDRLADPDWTDYQGWRYALPDEGVSDDAIEMAADHDLFLAGDWVAGEARLHAAIRNGLETGERIAEAL